ncbi:peptidylprolyl isomerase [Gordonia rubripertincta]|uniref:Peptidylprolyl isomerase n=1 Tax=Gordonia rubripertincta TaxID=36822 RepID=A0AAW4G6D9_GORRU|nr:peptidylprolyl isomerase [Gordonia rubripertincta]ASR03549.1 Putative bifunctional phosphatase/peptidyl-prolyl cis-trans isomerase [Gordonia rubripertincta]MBM7278779.1 peptidylprolyl isomerase [Gordonia rubripertincta]QMU19614.1 peptidylprolyl isomerase [Gordonia rubripertincta]
MTTNEERREAAKRKLEERLETERLARRKRKIVIASVSTAVVVAVVAGVTAVVVKKIMDDREAARWTSCAFEDAPSRFDQLPDQVPDNVPADQRPQYQAELDELKAAAKNERQSPKPDEKVLKSGTEQATFTTTQGVLPITLERDGAPCNVAAVTSLIENKFYDDTTCHRMTTSDKLKILQCGDPTGTGMSGPGWTSPDEPPTDLKKVGQPDPMSGSQPVVYPRGTVAIANSSQGGQNPNTGSSQLFIVINDSELGPDYSIVGKVDEPGLAVLDKVYEGGITPGPAGSQPGDGKPKTPVTIETAVID